MSRLSRKEWNFQVAEGVAAHDVFEAALGSLENCALVLPDGSALHVKPGGPADVATLPLAASLCHKYLKLGDGDVALTNDPFSGGTTLSSFTLVTGIRFAADGRREADVLLACRMDFPMRFGPNSKLDEEGVRVPPTPLAAAGQLNRDLLGAIASHPLAPKTLATVIENTMVGAGKVAAALKRLARDPSSEINKMTPKKYFAESGRAFENLMHKLPLGTSLVSTQLPTGETIKLQLKITEKRLIFDFAGTEASQTIALTDVATFGACMAVTSAIFNEPGLYDAGSYSYFQVTTPARTLVSSAPPVGTVRGMTQGLAVICDLIVQAFTKLTPSLKQAQSHGANGLIALEFEDGTYWGTAVAPGTGGAGAHTGVDAYARWGSKTFRTLSLEEAERAAPIMIVSAGIRANSGGNGQNRGGNGSQISLKVLKPGTARWIWGAGAFRQDGTESGRSGAAASVTVTRASEAREDFDKAEGSVKLEAGDSISFFAPGGGGWGAPKDADDEKE